jgi:hypothetical protein
VSVQKDDLRNLLSTLVDDCGYDAVREALEDFNPALKSTTASRNSSVKRSRKPRAKPNAIAIVDSLALPDEGKKSVLMTLARKYEEKAFMPNVNHVRFPGAGGERRFPNQVQRSGRFHRIQMSG